jgi:hypothetical protein
MNVEQNSVGGERLLSRRVLVANIELDARIGRGRRRRSAAGSPRRSPTARGSSRNSVGSKPQPNRHNWRSMTPRTRSPLRGRQSRGGARCGDSWCFGPGRRRRRGRGPSPVESARSAARQAEDTLTAAINVRDQIDRRLSETEIGLHNAQRRVEDCVRAVLWLELRQLVRDMVAELHQLKRETINVGRALSFFFTTCGPHPYPDAETDPDAAVLKSVVCSTRSTSCTVSASSRRVVARDVASACGRGRG